MEKRNSQLEHGQPRLVLHVRCQSQHQNHFKRMNLMFEAYCTGKRAWQLSIKFCVIHEAMNGFKNLNIH